MDVDRFASIIADINNYLVDLNDLSVTKESDLLDKKIYYSTSMIAFSLINRTIDLGELLVSEKDIGVPTSYREIFKLIRKANLIDIDLETKLSDLVYYRNMLAHEYQEYSEKEIFEVLNNLEVISVFVSVVKSLV